MRSSEAGALSPATHIASTERRATVLSFESRVARGFYGAAAVALGWGLDVAEFETVLAFTAALGLLPLVLAQRLRRAGGRRGSGGELRPDPHP